MPPVFGLCWESLAERDYPQSKLFFDVRVFLFRVILVCAKKDYFMKVTFVGGEKKGIVLIAPSDVDSYFCWAIWNDRFCFLKYPDPCDRTSFWGKKSNYMYVFCLLILLLCRSHICDEQQLQQLLELFFSIKSAECVFAIADPPLVNNALLEDSSLI